MIKYYREKNIPMLYWVEDNVVMCQDYNDNDPQASCFTTRSLK